MRDKLTTSAEKAAELVLISLENGADGFMFSVSELTLSMLRIMRERRNADQLKLYAIVPYAFEYVRIATQTGTPGLAKRFAKQIAVSGDVKTILTGLKAVMTMNPASLVSTYLAYEISRIRSSVGKQASLVSMLLHEVMTDMALALDFDWLFHSYVTYLSKLGMTPGFNTRNFPYLVRKFEEWNIDLGQTLIATPFNKAGFQMNPSKADCERALKDIPRPSVLAISILASGYLQPEEAIEYVAALPNIKGVTVGVSKERHALETFRLLKERLGESQ
jgi:hypothetical protein